MIYHSVHMYKAHKHYKLLTVQVLHQSLDTIVPFSVPSLTNNITNRALSRSLTSLTIDPSVTVVLPCLTPDNLQETPKINSRNSTVSKSPGGRLTRVMSNVASLSRFQRTEKNVTCGLKWSHTLEFIFRAATNLC